MAGSRHRAVCQQQSSDLIINVQLLSPLISFLLLLFFGGGGFFKIRSVISSLPGKKSASISGGGSQESVGWFAVQSRKVLRRKLQWEPCLVEGRCGNKE